MTPGATFSIGELSLVSMGPLPSIGMPRESTTRPSSASPTGTEVAATEDEEPVTDNTILEQPDAVVTTLEVNVKADAFEGLLEKAASEGKKGAGQYFTPRLLIQSIVRWTFTEGCSRAGSVLPPASPE